MLGTPYTHRAAAPLRYHDDPGSVRAHAVDQCVVGVVPLLLCICRDPDQLPLDLQLPGRCERRGELLVGLELEEVTVADLGPAGPAVRLRTHKVGNGAMVQWCNRCAIDMLQGGRSESDCSTVSEKGTGVANGSRILLFFPRILFFFPLVYVHVVCNVLRKEGGLDG